MPTSNRSRSLARPVLALAGLLVAAVATAAPPGDRDADDEVVVVRPRNRVVVRAAQPARDVRVIHLGGGFLGVELTSLTPELRRHFGVADDRGVMVSRVVEDSPAERAGLQVGDVVTAVDGEPVARSFDLGRQVRRRDGGETVEIAYVRDGRPGTTRAVVEEREGGVWASGEDVDFDFDFDFDFDPDQLRQLDRLKDLQIHIDPATIRSIEESVQRMMESEEWQERIHALQDVDMEELEEKMEEFQERLEELDLRLEERSRALERRREGDGGV